MKEEEWDWPPRRRFAELAPRRSGWSSPKVKKAVDIYFGSVVFLIKLAIALACGTLLFVCLWGILALFSLK
jgi:uncharacterized membrane protein YczE